MQLTAQIHPPKEIDLLVQLPNLFLPRRAYRFLCTSLDTNFLLNKSLGDTRIHKKRQRFGHSLLLLLWGSDWSRWCHDWCNFGRWLSRRGGR